MSTDRIRQSVWSLLKLYTLTWPTCNLCDEELTVGAPRDTGSWHMDDWVRGPRSKTLRGRGRTWKKEKSQTASIPVSNVLPLWSSIWRESLHRSAQYKSVLPSFFLVILPWLQSDCPTPWNSVYIYINIYWYIIIMYLDICKHCELHSSTLNRYESIGLTE